MSLVQGPFKAQGRTESGTFTGSMTSQPTNGNTLFLLYTGRDATTNPTVSSISQTGVTWTKAVSNNVNIDVEIWMGAVGAGAGTTITITVANGSGGNPDSLTSTSEFSGAYTLDQVASDPNGTGDTVVTTGTTPTTTHASELVIGEAATVGEGYDFGNLTSPLNGFTMLDGISTQIDASGDYAAIAFLYKSVSSTGAQSTSVTISFDSHASGCIATFFSSGAPPATPGTINLINSVLSSAIIKIDSTLLNLTYLINGILNTSSSGTGSGGGTGSGTFNSIWFFRSDIFPNYPSLTVNTAMLSALVGHNVFKLFPDVCALNPDGSMYYWFSDNEINAMLTGVRAYDSRFKIYGWMGSWDVANNQHDDYEDMSSATFRNAAIASEVAMVQKGFDGIQENSEDLINQNSTATNTGLIQFWNGLATSLHAANPNYKLIITCPAVWYDFNINYIKNLVGIDYAILYGVGSTAGNFVTQATEWMDNIPLSIPIIGCDFGGNQEGLGSMASQLSAYDSFYSGYSGASKANITGYTLYSWVDMDAPSWTSWDAWPKKN